MFHTFEMTDIVVLVLILMVLAVFICLRFAPTRAWPSEDEPEV